jgi:hypothetical protein
MLLDTHDPWGDLNTPSDSSAPKLDILTKDKALATTDLGSGGRGFVTAVVPVETRLALDFGAIWHGIEQFQPKYRSHFAPLGAPLPATAEGETWTPSVRMQAWVDGDGTLRILRVRGRIHLNRFKTLFQLFGYRPEAQDGKIPLYVFKGFEDISTDFGVYGGILLEFVDAIDRDETFFGPRITPPPPPILPSGPRVPVLPPAAVTPDGPVSPTEPTVYELRASSPAEAPVRTPFSVYRPVASTPAAPPAATSSPPPSPAPVAGKKLGSKKPY